MNVTDDELIQELSNRFAQSRKAFSDLSVVNRKLVEINRKLEQSESLKSNFLSNIRNEINNPLSAIMGLAGQLENLGRENPEIASIAMQIGSEATGLDFQLRTIFMAAELEAGEISPRYAPVMVSALMQDLVASFRFSAEKKNVLLVLNVLPDDGSVNAVLDYEKVQLIVSNLLSNAIEFSHKGGTVTLFCKVAEDGSLQVDVKDNGIGIALEDQQRIFDRFVQLDTGTMRAHPGHGLGLSITKALVDLLQGAITLDSIPEEGTLISVTLPPGTLCGKEDAFFEGGNLFIFDDVSEA